MKKILFGIFSIILGFVGFSFGDTFYGNSFSCYLGTPISGYIQCTDDVLNFGNGNDITSGKYILTVEVSNGLSFQYIGGFRPYIGGVSSAYNTSSAMGYFFSCSESFPCREFNPYNYYNIVGEGLVTFTVLEFQGGGSSSSDITVYYNSGSSTNITCDGVQAIQINGLSTITSTNTFTPYYNISYIDEDNQSLIESYSKDILYLENGQFKKTYTGNNDRILTYQGSSDSTFTGYVPVFDFTGDTIINTGNVFNNFSDNALKVLLSNIPSYIQYITIFMILVFLFSFIRRFKRKS